jgi:hypothetical protein
MALNDKEGDCTIAGAVHVDQAGAFVVKEEWAYPGDPDVHSTYRQLTGGGDTGLQLPQVLRPWENPGLFGKGELFQNDGYAQIDPKNHTLVQQGVWIFGAGYIAVDLPMPAQQQFRPDGSGVWELTNTPLDQDIEGGHCIAPVGYNDRGVICVTWGSTVLVTWEWWDTYVVQVYVVIPPAFVERGGNAQGVDLAKIKQICESLDPTPAPGPLPWWEAPLVPIEHVIEEVVHEAEELIAPAPGATPPADPPVDPPEEGDTHDDE